MGCGGSTPEPVEEVKQAAEYQNADQLQNQEFDDIRSDLDRAEAAAVEAGPERNTFIGSVLQARAGHETDASIMGECCTKLQAHNRKLKSLIATADAQAVNEAMNGGFLGLGCNDKKLMAALCSRTKSQLSMTRKRYRDMYDKDMKDEVKGETGGYYGKMMSVAMSAKDEYVADMFDLACGGMGCNEEYLIELYCMCDQKWLREGKKKWEGRTDKSLIDYLNTELGSSYKQLNMLLHLLLTGERNDEDDDGVMLAVDEAVVAEQVAAIRAQTENTGWFSDPVAIEVLVNIIGKNNTAQNCRLAEVFENTHNMSLRKAITDKCDKKIGWALVSLLLPTPDFVAARVKKAMDGWGTDKSTLYRLLGGLDGKNMMGMLEAYERKYGLPLASSLHKEIGGHFATAALMWIRTLDDPTGGVEMATEADVPLGFLGVGANAEKLASMCDFLLLEHEMLLRFCASLDVETLAEAIKGASTDDTVFIRTITTRSKRFLARISYDYREEYDATLSQLVDDNLPSSKDPWYPYLAKFLVLQPAQSDSLLLDIALDDSEQGEVQDKNALIEFLCARHPRRVRAAKKQWEKRNDTSLVDALSDKLHGDLRKIALAMLKGKRNQDLLNEDEADVELAKKQAALLKEDMGKHAIDILCSNSPAQNAQISRQYEETYDTSLPRALREEFDGFAKAALSALLLEPAYWYAARLKASFKGDGASDRAVCRIIGAHDKAEIKAIAAAYDDKYGERLPSAIEKHCTGDYRRLAVAWIKLPDQLEQPEDLIELPKPEVEEAAADEKDDLDAAYEYVNENLKPKLPEPAKEEFETPYTPPAPPSGAPPTSPPPGMPMGAQPQMNMYGTHQAPMPMMPNPAMQMQQMMSGFNQGTMSHQTTMTTTSTMYQQSTQTYNQAMYQPPGAATRKMAAVVPFGMWGGQQMQVNTNNIPPHYGRMMVTIPPGYGPGSKFTFAIPAGF